MAVFVLTLAGFVLGSIPFSVLLGRLAVKADIRQVGDHNPGATNVLRAAGWRWGLLAMLLDAFKGALPVGIAWFLLAIHGWQIIPVFLAPLIGHAYSPWLRFRGGKAVATTFGAWAGLTLGVGPTLLGLLLGLMYIVCKSSGWAITLAMLCLGVFIGLYYAPTYPEFMWAWAGNMVILLLRHYQELLLFPRLRTFRRVSGGG
jgi:glycerol-3-phosphate acyltransferase PlsY